MKFFPLMYASTVKSFRQDFPNICHVVRVIFFSLYKLLIRFQSSKITENHFVAIYFNYLSSARSFQTFLIFSNYIKLPYSNIFLTIFGKSVGSKLLSESSYSPDLSHLEKSLFSSIFFFL